MTAKLCGLIAETAAATTTTASIAISANAVLFIIRVFISIPRGICFRQDLQD
jgi:hypothetical protein